MTSEYVRTALFSRNQPGGVFTINDLVNHPGNIFFVDSGETVNGADSVGFGRSPDSPFLTLDYAIAFCTANNGDVIYCMPGHAENLDADSAVDVDVAGVKIIGLGWGGSRPTFTCTVIAGDFKLAGAGCHWIENLLFVNAVDDSTGLLEISAGDCTIVNCEFRDTGAVFADVMVLTTADADNLTIRDCRFQSNAADGSVSAIELVEADYAHIYNCYFVGNFDTGVIQCITTASTYINIHDCTMFQLDDTAGAAGVQMVMDTITGSTGVIGPNLWLAGIIDAANVTEAVTGATFRLFDPIYVVNAVAEKALLINWTATTD